MNKIKYCVVHYKSRHRQRKLKTFDDIPEAIKYHDDYASRFPNRRLFVLKESDVINPFPKLVKRKSKVA